MLDDVYQTFDDPDGNFLEQFQTSGFNARFLELYLFAYFTRTGFAVDRPAAGPDFIATKEGLPIAVEATTVNPSESGTMSSQRTKKISEMSTDELRRYQLHELPIRFGSPLLSKLKKRYWERKTCRGLPLVIAVEAFHEEESLAMSDWSLARYLYGLEQTGAWGTGGRLQIRTSKVDSHSVRDKVVPSGFFDQPDAENISAVLFTNSGTSAKFARMGYQHGVGHESVFIRRTGYCFNQDPDAMDPTFFSYSLSEPPFVERWGQGLVLLHNPRARHPIPREVFADIVQTYAEEGFLKSDHPDWHPILSKTIVLHLEKGALSALRSLPTSIPQVAVGAITQEHFRDARGVELPDSNPFVEESGWFADEAMGFLGVVVRDKTDGDWGYVVLARDQYFQFKAIEMQSSISHRHQAVMELQGKISALLASPQRIFPQS
jgi:hypothetical protein